MRRGSVLALTFTLVLVLMISLTAGSLRPKTEDQIDGLRHFRSMEVITGKQTIWSENWKSQSAWGESGPPGAISTIRVNGSLILSANFQPANATAIIQVYRNVNLSLDRDPSLDITLNVPTGVSYGISFLGHYPNGTLFNTETESSYLQNRQGLGGIERISANLIREVYVATGVPPPTTSKVTRIVFYLAATPSTSLGFSMKILDITAYSFQRFLTDDQMTASTALGLMLNLDSLPSNETLFQLIAGFDISGSSDLAYTLYFVNGYSVVAQGGVYHSKILLTYEIAPLIPSRVSSAPPFYTKNSLWSVVIVAQQGEITHFRLDTLALRYTLEKLPRVANLDPNFIRIVLDVYLLLLFVIPIDSVIILRWLSKPEA